MRGVRKFATLASRTAELAARTDASNSYGVRVSKAQSHVDGFVGGKNSYSHPLNGRGTESAKQSVTHHSFV